MSPAVDYARLAGLYDALVRYDEDIPFFLEECRDVRGPVLELMSGTGRVSIPLAAADVALTCVDSSPSMLEILRGKVSAGSWQVRVELQDVTRLELEQRYDLALIAFNSFEELIDMDDRHRALQAVRRHLEPGGRFVCTLHNPTSALRELTSGPGVVAEADVGEDRVKLEVDLRHDPRTGIVRGTEILSRLDCSGELIDREVLELCYALILPEDFRQLARDAGFVVTALFGDYDRSEFDPETSPSSIWTLTA